jgi:hypothetical protein
MIIFVILGHLCQQDIFQDEWVGVRVGFGFAVGFAVGFGCGGSGVRWWSSGGGLGSGGQNQGQGCGGLSGVGGTSVGTYLINGKISKEIKPGAVAVGVMVLVAVVVGILVEVTISVAVGPGVTVAFNVAVDAGSLVSNASIVASRSEFELRLLDKSIVTAPGNWQAEIDTINIKMIIKNNLFFFNVNLPTQVWTLFDRIAEMKSVFSSNNNLCSIARLKQIYYLLLRHPTVIITVGSAVQDNSFNYVKLFLYYFTIILSLNLI